MQPWRVAQRQWVTCREYLVAARIFPRGYPLPLSYTTVVVIVHVQAATAASHLVADGVLWIVHDLNLSGGLCRRLAQEPVGMSLACMCGIL